VLSDPLSRVPIMGASGAIAGVMGAYLVKFRAPGCRCCFSPSSFFASICRRGSCWRYWFALQVFGGFGRITESAQGGTAFFAHVGGFVAGIALVYLMGARERFSRRKDLYW